MADERTARDVMTDAIDLLERVSSAGNGAGQHGFERDLAVGDIARMAELMKEMFDMGMDV